jgi:hypothetical protein
MAGVVFAALGALAGLLLIPTLHGPTAGFPSYIFVVIGLCAVLGAVMGRRSLGLWYVLDQVVLLLRLTLR